MITNLQLLRAFAALAVVFYHTGYRVLGFSSDFLGVCVFFVISGFIMTHVSRQSADGFLTKRLIRIVPLYWIATLAYLIWNNMGFANPVYTFPLFAKWLLENPRQLLVWAADHHGMTSASAWAALVQSLLFVPYQNAAGDVHPILGVGWTLNLEMYFYVLFALGLFVNQRYAPLAAAGVILAIMAAMPDRGPLSLYGHPYVWHFALGIVCYYAWRALDGVATAWSPVAMAWLAVPIGAGYLFFSFFPPMFYGGSVLVGGLLAVALPFSLVLFALLAHSAGASIGQRFVLLLGDASYALYLTHLFVVDTMRPVGQKWPLLDTSSSVTAVTLVLVLSIGLAIAVHLYVEKPVTRAIKRVLESRRATSTDGPIRA